MAKRIKSTRPLALCLAAVTAWIANVGPAAAQQQVSVVFQSQANLYAVARPVPPGGDAVRVALEALVAGPSDAERAQGIYSAIPAGVSLTVLDATPGAVQVGLSRAAVDQGFDDAVSEEIYEQVRWTLRQFELENGADVTVDGYPLYAYLKPAPKIRPREDADAMQTEGLLPIIPAGTALSGKKISMSPGHGRYWHGDTWYYDRGINCPPLNREDDHNNELVGYLQLFLAQDGATLKIYRCVDKSFGNYPLTGDPWWRMSGSYWLKQIGYPCSIYANATGDCNLGTGANEYSDTVRSRPLASNYDNTNVHLSMHTNAYQGDCYGSCPNGTATYYDASSSHAAYAAVSQQFAQAVQSNIVSTIRNHYTDATWRDRGAPDANGAFAETRMPTRAAILIELAFHDSCDRDALYLQDNFFRSATMWGVYKGICQYFGVTATYGFYANELVSENIPTTMLAGQSYNVSIVMRNRSVLWNSAKGYKLGAAGDSDPFYPTLRVPVTGEVNTGGTFAFNFTMTAPTTPGTYTTDWQMLREWVTWFGVIVTKQVQVQGTNPQAPSITQQPTNQSVPEGATATFSLQAGGSPPFTYQWKKGSTNLTNGGRISGAASATLQISGAQSGDAGSYSCTVSNSYGSTSTNTVTLTVTPNVFIVESRTGGQNFAKYSETGVWADVTGKSSASGTTAGIGSRYGSTYRSVAGEKHALSKADLPVAGDYEVFATWAATSNRRSPILYRITHANGVSDVQIDQNATANAWVSLGTFGFAAGTDVGIVDMSNLLTDLSGSMYADAVKWEFRAVTQVFPPTVTQHPANGNICPGASVNFTVAATGQGTLTYQWQKNGSNLSNGGHYAGATTATLTVSSAAAADAADYRCMVGNAGGSVPSNAAALTLKAATAITQQPASDSVQLDGSMLFTVAATGEGSVTYQWQKNNVNLANGGHYAGVTTSTLTIAHADAGDVAAYRCVVTAGCGSVNSDAANLTIAAPPPIPGDYDGDRDIDLDDYAHLQNCLSGAGVPASALCLDADLDQDQDVDAVDSNLLRNCMSGPGIEADLNCLN